MKIRITLTVEVNRDDWAMAYALDPEEVRNSVKSYIANNVNGADDARIKLLNWK